MDEQFKKRLTKKQIFTIPNILSFFRILLIPVIIVLYVVFDLHFFAAGVIVLSGLTDVADGFIARKFNMVSDFGKFLDPLADKLTQMAMVVCVATKVWWVIILLGFLITKDILLFLWGLIVFRRFDNVNSSRWYGKACTVLVYATMFALFVVPDMPLEIVGFLFGLCLFAVTSSTILYGIFYGRILKKKDQQKG